MTDSSDVLKPIIQNILQTMQSMTGEEIQAVMETVTADMSLQEKHAFNLLLFEQMMAEKGWTEVDINSVNNTCTQTPPHKASSEIELTPPWIQYPKIPCYSIGWRMGHGEHYMLEWMNWIADKDITTRIAYFKKYLPLPVSWVLWIASFCGYRNAEDSEETMLQTIVKLEGLGLANLNEFKQWRDERKKARLEAKKRNEI